MSSTNWCNLASFTLPVGNWQSPMFKNHPICNDTSCNIFVQPLTSARGIRNVIRKPPLTFEHGMMHYDFQQRNLLFLNRFQNDVGFHCTHFSIFKDYFAQQISLEQQYMNRDECFTYWDKSLQLCLCLAKKITKLNEIDSMERIAHSSLAKCLFQALCALSHKLWSTQWIAFHLKHGKRFKDLGIFTLMGDKALTQMNGTSPVFH